MVVGHAKVGPQLSTAGIALSRLLKVMLGVLVVLLLHGDIAQSPPSIVVVFICKQCLRIVLLSLLKIFISNVLVPTESKCISKRLIELNRAAEELNCRLMLSLQTVAVAQDAPRLRSKKTLL